MNYLIIVLGVLIAVSGVVMVIKPEPIFEWMRRQVELLSFYVLAVVVRLLLGAALVLYAASSKFPLVLEVLGWISVSAGLALACIGRSRFKRLILWLLDLVTPTYRRVTGLLPILFGGFLVYAVW